MLKGVGEDFLQDLDPEETAEWLESLEDVIHRQGTNRARQLLSLLQEKAYREGVKMPFTANTPYINTIPIAEQPRYPGNREIERRIKSIIRWNAMAMVTRANKVSSEYGGHISSYASAATLLEVGFNHFFKGKEAPGGGDIVFFQGHASPGVYARAFVEGRLGEANLEHFRRELQGDVQGLCSYPHPWLMSNFWEFPTVSMGLGPLFAIYHARFNRYLEDRGIMDTSASKVWCYIGDGECDEPETLGAINLASREGLDNLIFVINCNLQRLDGPVRGNGKIIQELEAVFRGAGWNVIKVIWASEWDHLLASDTSGELVRRMGATVDGQYQKYQVESGEYVRQNFFTGPEMTQLVEHLSDEQIKRLKRGGHDPEKVYAAYKAAVEHRGSPTVILVKTTKGYGQGAAGEGQNVAHNQKKLNEEALRQFRDRFGLPISDEEVSKAPFYLPPADSDEMKYLKDRRRELGGSLPARIPNNTPLEIPPLESMEQFCKDTGDREGSTTMAFGRFFSWLLKDKKIGKLIVPIIPDEARTFGMESLFRQCGIYAHRGQLYEPVDSDQILYYREAKDGQILEEGINEAGAISSFLAAGTSYAVHGQAMIPFYIYYSMFGFQRVGDQIWAAADSRCRGFLLGGTAGRTTLAGEGLQHQDGHSHLVASTIPNLMCYDPAFGYETVVIVQDGLRRMYQECEDIFYYITLYNEAYTHPGMPANCQEGILKGMYLFRSTDGNRTGSRPQLFGSGTILREALAAQEILAEKYGIGCDVWSVTSYKELRREALEVERWNLFHPGQTPRVPYITQVLDGRNGPFIAVSDYMHIVAEQIAKWLPSRLVTLGTDGFGRSDGRKALRRHFEVDAAHTAYATLNSLMQRGELDASVVQNAIGELGLDPEKKNPQSA